ncbi:DUF2272 domain-containing protein [Galbibacter sp. BG1]|uniref:DUF2272 domain-containing protein n=1 Tax=Galbibacter sp. BG1 TaxID=1170699 RepID=UPI0015BACFB2|nr:DUF2272 domain-containing protein [Galbibacter sp. BG1]QLE03003.1 DUF2272 domain-containing protein [Galbibacter sp. BG1]
MASIQFSFSAGDDRQHEIDSVSISAKMPKFSFKIERNQVFRYVNGYEQFNTSQDLDDNTYKLNLPLDALVGDDVNDIYGFFLFHFIEILNREGVDINDYSFKFTVTTRDEYNQIINTKEFEGIYYLKSPISSDYDRKYYQQEYAKFIGTYGDILSDAKDPLNEKGLKNLAEQYNKRVFLINKEVYELFKYIFDVIYPDRSISDELVLNFIQILVDLNGEHPKLSTADFTVSYTQLMDFLKRTEYTVNEEFFDYLKDNFNKLFDFPLEIPPIEAIGIAGNLEIESEDELSQADLDAYDLSVEYQQSNGDSKILKYNWSKEEETIADNSIDFDFTKNKPILVNNISGDVTVRVKGFDGAVLWEENYDRDDETLQDLSISLRKYPTDGLEVDPQTGKPKSTKRLRGKVLQKGKKYNLNELTVIVQAKKEGDEIYRIVTSGTTDKSGNFSMDYPYGDYVEAQAMVSIMPNSPVDLVINADDKNETVSDDFIYLLLVEEEVSIPEEGDQHDDCECHSKTKAKRLPDQADLIESDEYTQDIGGACLNLSTPNRTLREYRYNAIVRISDPDVSNYVLEKKNVRDGKGLRVEYNLVGGNKKIQRKEVDLNNPIRWEDAPDAKENISMYQAVTVATGHILHYKSVFKADGYSLGDLVYSLPLAPGQKKQIVVFESSHSFAGAEAQDISQGEELSSQLISDRFITDQLSGGLDENMSGRSKAHTSGMSAGLGASGSYGGFGASLGVAGGFSNSNSSASQNSSRNITQFFGEKLRQSLMQNAESYRELNASVVTTVTQDQDYGVTAETIANHNHCHSLTMMYFEVLRHYAIYQELSHVEECVFVPLLMTNFSTENIHKWKDILATNLLPIPSNTYLRRSWLSFLRRRQSHPLLKAFDANKRIKTDYTRVDYPAEGTTYADGRITDIKGDFTLRIELRRPKSKYDRIKSLPIITKTITHKDVDYFETAKKGIFDSFLGAVTGGLSLLATGVPGTNVKYKTREEEILVKAAIFDQFMVLDANYQTVPPSRCIRIKSFQPRPISLPIFDITVSGGYNGEEFFEDGHVDKEQWTAYSEILGYTSVYDFLDYYFAGRLIAEWDSIFNNDILPEVYDKIVNSIYIDELGADLTRTTRYTGGNRRMTIKVNGHSTKTRRQLPLYIKMKCNNNAVKKLDGGNTLLIVERVRLNYTTEHFEGRLFRGNPTDDLLDSNGVELYIPLTARDETDPRKEDRYIVNELIEHLNSHLEHYNKVLWKNLDADRRYMLLDGFNIQTYTSTGQKSVMRSLASVVKNELITITGNSLVFPVADGYRVGRDNMLEEIGDNVFLETSLFDYYKPLTPVPPYRLSVPTRGVFMEAIQGSCDACEMVKENSSQDWDKFRTEEPTSIAPIVTPTPSITEYRPEYKDFASPMVNIQNAPDAPAPGAGLSQLSELLGKPGAFNDITGLAKNQDNAIRTYLSNQENAKAFAEMSKSLATQQHNTQNSQNIAEGISQARQAGNITEEDAQNLTRQHLQQQIDGGESVRETAQFERERNRPSLAQTASEAINRGQTVQAQRTDADGTHESINVRPSEGSQPINVNYQVEGMTQPTMGCWATVATMLMNWKLRSSNTIPEILAIAGNNLNPANENYYVDMFNNETGLFASEKNQFIHALGLEAMPPASYTLRQYYDWLSTYGPLWVTIDADSSSGFSPHALLLFGMEGDLNNPNDVTFKFVNPQNGQEQFEYFDAFIEMFEQMVTDNSGNLFLQIVRFSDRLIQQSEGQGNTSSTPWDIPADTVVDYATQVAHDEFNTWWTGGLLDNNNDGIAKVTEYWLPFRTVSGAESTARQTVPDQVAWSAAFISYLFMRAYLHAVVSHFPDNASYNGHSIENYDSLNNTNKRILLRRAKTCLETLGIFEPSGNHIRYISQSMQLSGNTMVLHDPSNEAVQLGDLIVNGRSGSSYTIDAQGRISPSSGSSHVDIVVEIVEIDGDNFARLVGGNTTNASNKVAYKLRPLDSDGKLIQESDLNNISLDIINQNIRDNISVIGDGSAGYYSISGLSGLIDGAGTYERLIISETDVIARYT